MKKCLRQKCQKEFEPNKPKQVFCSAKCRVYNSRESNINTSVSLPKDYVDVANIGVLSADGSVKPLIGKPKDKVSKMLSDFQKGISNEPPRLKGETSIEYRLRMIELSENKTK